MAEPGAETAAPKKGSPFLKRKVAGIPMPVVLIVAGVGAYLLYKKYKGSQTSSSSAATPTASSAAPVDTSGGYVDPNAGGGGVPSVSSAPLNNGIDPSTGLPWSGFGQQSPTDTGIFTPPPPASLNTRNPPTVSQLQARIATTERDIAAAKKELASAKTAAQRKAAEAKLKSAENALKTQTATLNKAKAAA